MTAVEREYGREICVVGIVANKLRSASFLDKTLAIRAIFFPTVRTRFVLLIELKASWAESASEDSN
jgi:hypothetical protein